MDEGGPERRVPIRRIARSGVVPRADVDVGRSMEPVAGRNPEVHVAVGGGGHPQSGVEVLRPELEHGWLVGTIGGRHLIDHPPAEREPRRHRERRLAVHGQRCVGVAELGGLVAHAEGLTEIDVDQPGGVGERCRREVECHGLGRRPGPFPDEVPARHSHHLVLGAERRCREPSGRGSQPELPGHRVPPPAKDVGRHTVQRLASRVVLGGQRNQGHTEVSRASRRWLQAGGWSSGDPGYWKVPCAPSCCRPSRSAPSTSISQRTTAGWDCSGLSRSGRRRPSTSFAAPGSGAGAAPGSRPDGSGRPCAISSRPRPRRGGRRRRVSRATRDSMSRIRRSSTTWRLWRTWRTSSPEGRVGSARWAPTSPPATSCAPLSGMSCVRQYRKRPDWTYADD